VSTGLAVATYLCAQVCFVERLVSWSFSSYDTVALLLSLTEWQEQDSLRSELVAKAL